MAEEENQKAEENQKVEKPEFEKKLDEIRTENERMERNIKELKELAAIKALGGQTTEAPEEKPHEETPKEYKERIMSGKWR